ncbi:MAG: type II secretion system secretin GspD [Pseudomonadales bacterium]|nr:type II secretion system secretin GspD [Pseudomonadales bacterium]MCP5330227.1 type II secretion system secretin GspD [Pseudomonadales bacterium]MCP5344156.1 type II secretion system secretin GspD [Pseudomonadales bacterium]
MNATRPLALLSLAITLASCSALPARDTSAGSGTAGSAGNRARSAAVMPSQGIAEMPQELSQNDTRQSLIAQINRDGAQANNGAYRDPAPAALNATADNVVELNYEQADLRTILEELADALDTSIIIDPSIADKVSIRTSPNRPLSQADIWPLIRLLTRQAGVTLERAGNLYYARKQQSNLPVEITTPERMDGSTASVVMQITPLSYVSIATALELLGPLVQPDGTMLRISNNTLAISASSSQLARINSLLEVVDSDPFQNQGLRLYPLNFASAADVAQELTDVLQLIEGANPAYQVKGLERINAVLVTAPANRGFEEISRWVQLLDADSQEQAEQLFHYRVKNLTATELATTLSNVFELNENDEEGTQAPVVGTRPETVNIVTPEGDTLSRTVPVPAFAASAGAEQAVSANLKVSIVADEATNSLLIRANPRDYRQLLSTISQLDSVPLQVMINAVIAQISLTDETRFGVDWSRVADNAATNAISTTTSTGFLPNGGLDGLLFTKSFLDGAARVEATLEAIASNNDVRLLARPSLTVVNNMEGEIQIGSEVPVQSGSTTTQSGDNIISSIQYRPTGIELYITPRINNDGVVNLTIRQVLSSIQESTGVANNPIFENQEISTTVVVRDGENVVLGGLIQNADTNTNSGVPGLNRVPVLGSLFSYRQDTTERKELFIVLRPEIVNLNDSAGTLYEEILNRFELAAEMIEDAGL